MITVRRRPISRLVFVHLGVTCLIGISSRVTPATADETGKTTPALSVTEPAVALGDPITLQIAGLAEWVRTHKDRDLKKLTLYLDGQPLDGLEPRIDTEQGTARYELMRTDKTRQSWCRTSERSLRGNARSVTAGFSDGLMLPGEANTDLTVLKRDPSSGFHCRSIYSRSAPSCTSSRAAISFAMPDQNPVALCGSPSVWHAHRWPCGSFWSWAHTSSSGW